MLLVLVLVLVLWMDSWVAEELIVPTERSATKLPKLLKEKTKDARVHFQLGECT